MMPTVAPATITVTGTDGCGNSASVTYTATILTTLPVLTGCPSDVTVHCPAAIPTVATVTAKDACGTDLTVTPSETESNPGGCTNVITRTWTTTDCAGNVNSCTQVVTLHTDGAPTVNKGTIAASCYKTLAAAKTAALAVTTGTGACGDALSFSASADANSCPATITVTGTDGCGNSASVTYTATILTTLPVLTGCPSDVTVHCPAAIPTAATVTAKDACGTDLTVTPSETQSNPGGCTNVITRTWTTTDCAGNVNSCTQVVTLHTDGASTVNKGTIAASCYKTLAAAKTAALAVTTGTGACGDALSFSASDDANSCPATITVTGTDGCGNSASVTYTATILTTLPVLTGCPTDVTVHCPRPSRWRPQ